MVVPSLGLAFWIIGYPIYDVIMAASHEVNRFGKLRDFVGTGNFQTLMADPIFWGSFRRTILWTVGVVAGTILLSLPIALILNDDFHGRGLMRVIIMLPWAVSLTMTAIVWTWSLHGQYGMVNETLQDLGLIGQPIQWLATARLAFPVEILIGILVSIPFTTTVFLGGLASLPGDIYEAARIDGASVWQRFTHLTLPLLKSFFNIALVLNVIHVFNSFPIIWVMTKGDPANGTDIFVTYLYKLAFLYGRIGDAAAMSLIMFSILLAFTLVYARMVMRSEGASRD
ncbi:MAG: sugar ABC transporter permease [Rhizobiales bacterium]|nr:sugar ABC transporter permease [Hyphomicrobiales bacterium]